SRRRHTRSDRDWSSDVCSSDLVFSDRLFLEGAPNKQIGTDSGRCVLIDAAAFNFDCSVTAHIPEGAPLDAGDIMSAGSLTLVERSEERRVGNEGRCGGQIIDWA